jgi:hypothetical protein
MFIYISSRGRGYALLAKGRTLVLLGYAAAYARVYVGVHCVLELFTKRFLECADPCMNRNA